VNNPEVTDLLGVLLLVGLIAIAGKPRVRRQFLAN
jgi:hypothetical protein